MAAETIGIIGLGLLGSAISERLQQAGFDLLGYDVESSRLRGLADRGGRPAASAADVARSADRIILSLPDSNIVASVLQGLSDELRPDLKIIDTTTGEPARSTQLGLGLSERGIHYLDATVSGSSEQVRHRDVIVLVGGERAVSDACGDLFATFARAWYHLGTWGTGARMKLVVNLVLGLNRLALAEGLTFARACGVDLAETLRVLSDSAAYSKVMDAKGRKMIEQDFAPQAKLSQHLKDVRLILAEALRAGADVPVSKLHHDLLTRLEEGGLGGLDNSAILRAFE
jgi:3-hydroxyisobutyrate dehydrogenase-like beta-hydroxyacid dehydrogenase